MKRRIHPLRTCLAAGIILMLSAAALLLVPSLDASDPHDIPWSTNVPISDPETVPHNPVVALDTAGHAYAAWHDARSGAARGIYVASQPAGGTWTTPIKIPGSDAGNPSSPAIAAGASGQVYVAWVGGFPETRADIRFAWSTDGGLTWQEPVHVNTDHQDIAGQPDLTVDAAGSVHLVWSDLAMFGDPHSRDVKWSMRPAGQDAWTAPAVIHPDVQVYTAQAGPAVTADGQGNVFAIWEDTRHGPADAGAIYAARLPAGRSQWEPGRRVDQRAGQSNLRPDIAAGPDGTLLAVWDGGRGAVCSAVLRPGAPAWDEPMPVTRVGSQQGITLPRVAVDSRGIGYVVWQDSRDGDPDVYAAVRWPASPEWGESSRVNDDGGPAVQEMPAIVAAGPGHAVVVWLDRRAGGSAAVYAADLRLAVRAVGLPLVAR